ncbi:MAG TPA: metal-dependent hydrolase, partial [Alphaproteobacteria bacterium]|nr:metal-dependent hydrolase [Alphaproteobacteria bacterium]
PDIDHPGSAVGQRLDFIAKPLAAVVGHRGVTHSLLAIAACVAALWFYGLSAALVAPLAIGYLSHLAADALTPSGVPLLWPVKRRYTFPLTVPTGSLWEYLIVGALALAAAWLNGYHVPRHWFRALDGLLP